MLRIVQCSIVAVMFTALISQSALAAKPGKLPPQPAARRAMPQHPGVWAGPGQPALDAPLYASPVQYVPHQMGGAFYTNQAFAPHEMLYAHKYKAMYGPFYYKVKGHYVMTRQGVKVQERWYLQGTEVEVEYKDHFSLFDNLHSRFFR